MTEPSDSPGRKATPEEKSKILVVDQSGNASLTITELGVFDADPLQHLDYAKVEADSGVKEISWNSDEITGEYVEGTTLENVMINGSPADTSGYSLTGGSGYIYIQTKTEAPLQHLLSWYSEDGNTMKLQNNVTAYAGDISIHDNEYFVPLVNLGQDETWSGVSNIVDTPFYGTVKRTLGNPLPYAPDGIDSPRTFAYKMVKQKEARDNIKRAGETTTALDNSYEQGYARKEEFTILGAYKPFLPGYYLPYGETSYNASFKPEMSAGVDDLGLLQGAMSMMEGVEFYNLDETDIGTELDAYYKMNSSAPGLDDDNKPVFNATEAQSYDKILKMSMADIERGSIVVPDISDIRAGDLLVRNNVDSHHIGVVVGFRGTKPSAATAAPDWWENVLVVSVRPGFQSVTLGTWGNVNGIFGGFTENPEQYMVRRLVKYTDTPMTAEVVECINSVYHQCYPEYIEKGKTPFYAHSFKDTIEIEVDEEGNQVLDDENNPVEIVTQTRYNKFLTSPLRYYKEQPPTGYFQNRTPISLFDSNPKDDVKDEPMRPTNYTGWRELKDSYNIKYHRGMDVVPSVTSPESSFIRAPEDGKYWLVNLEGADETDQRYIQIDDDNFLILERYYQSAFGDIGVLVTNPADPQKGRIYLFMHQYFDDVNQAYSNNFTDEDGNAKSSLPDSWNNGGYVKAGDWIGIMAGNPTYPDHVHVEVYEFFDKYEHGDSVEDANQSKKELNYDEIKDKINTMYSDDDINVDLDTVKDSIHWQRIDPRTVFMKGLITEIAENYDEVQKVINELLSDDNYWTDVLNGNETKEDKISQLFEDWTKWTETTREDFDE